MDLGFDVVELPPPDHPEAGDRAPDFTRPLVDDEYWEDTALSALDAPVCLVCHPMDGSFPATYIWNELRDRGFDDLGATVVGVSISTPYAHKRFIEDHDLAGTEFRFFSDPANGVAETYGITNDLDGMGGVAEARPATFVLDEELTVQYAWVAREHPELPDYDDLEAAVVEAVGATTVADAD
ncbi:MAG: peroxiredoxin [halophilic archaeon J07HX64]|jgi:Peroxiredoxin|nr:MAG: peroxiredoxin [halophilic archaeon J07HX64]